jgi:hypothetical protein
MTTTDHRRKVFTVTLWNPETGDSFSIAIDAYDVAHAEKLARGTYGKPGYIVQVARQVAQ